MYPENLYYTKEHEWIRIEDERAIMGITDYAQDQLGDIVYVELPEVGSCVTQHEICGSIESVKTVSDLYAPLSGEIITINEALDETPELINNDPYTTGWIVEIRFSAHDELNNALRADAYEALIQ